MKESGILAGSTPRLVAVSLAGVLWALSRQGARCVSAIPFLICLVAIISTFLQSVFVSMTQISPWYSRAVSEGAVGLLSGSEVFLLRLYEMQLEVSCRHS